MIGHSLLPGPVLQSSVNSRITQLGLLEERPLVGMHIRRSDKSAMLPHQMLVKYMVVAEDFFRRWVDKENF